MYDTARRVALVKQRVRENTRRKQRRGIYGLSAMCMLLFAAVDINSLRILKNSIFPGKSRRFPKTTYCVLKTIMLRYL